VIIYVYCYFYQLLVVSLSFASRFSGCKRLESLHFIFVIEKSFSFAFSRKKILNNAKRDTKNEIRKKECNLFRKQKLYLKNEMIKSFHDFFPFKYARNLNLCNKKLG
jgi:hypothetical protein